MAIIFGGQIMIFPNATGEGVQRLIAQMQHACQKFNDDGRPKSNGDMT